MDRITRWVRDDRYSMAIRLVGLARLTSTLSMAKLVNVRGSRFLDMLDLLFRVLPEEAKDLRESSTPRMRGLFRQFCFAHVEHATLEEARGGNWSKFKQRIRQLRKARRFLKGRGDVPDLRGLAGEVVPAFAQVEAIGIEEGSTEDVESLFQRYLLARLSGRECFGDGFFGWPMVPGLAVTWLSVAAIGWLARYSAASRGRTSATFENFISAVGVVGRAIARLPAVGSPAERMRISYLLRDDGIARLVKDYAF
ncbi:MAG: hypothetical protein AABZ47_09620 [Planctomycetota bacterium]